MVVTDKLRAYLDGVELTFGADSEHRQGGPFNLENNANLIERFHNTLEQRTRVFKRYDSIEDIKLLTDGWLINYNFFKQHEGIGNIPLPDIDYKVSLHRRASVKRGKVLDAILTPVVKPA
ncbi:MAG: transposase, partial [Chloroflexi bacterium]|nr:transposase [Chloroflexota bacterium]